MEKILEVKDLCKKNILRDITFDIPEGEFTAVMGPSGSGKSTLLYNVSGMDRADSGEAVLDGERITGLDEEECARIRLHKMGFVFQQMNVLKNLNIIDNIIFPSSRALRGRKALKAQKKKAMDLMKEFHIDDLAERKVTEVSGGQLQRACIVRSIMMDPKILFCDEPTGALNQKAAGEVIDAFEKLNGKGMTILMVTHDIKTAARCDRILYILDGEIKGELKLCKDSDHAEREETGPFSFSMMYNDWKLYSIGKGETYEKDKRTDGALSGSSYGHVSHFL